MPAGSSAQRRGGGKVKRKEDEGTEDRTRDRGLHSENFPGDLRKTGSFSIKKSDTQQISARFDNTMSAK